MNVKINNMHSREFTAEQGVPQGSPLSPLLFNIFCYDMQRQNPQNEGASSYILQYADDTALVSDHKTLSKANDELQRMTNQIQTWLNRWRLLANPLKTQYLIFNHTPFIASPTISLLNHTIYPRILYKIPRHTTGPQVKFQPSHKTGKTQNYNKDKTFPSLNLQKPRHQQPECNQNL
ncbi:hypothetical protein JTB14_000055 [Gonioctena quinquepunctata]|nr:hypothetical protein JTB14_000055 [Gonioctena quinquepunctata]